MGKNCVRLTVTTDRDWKMWISFQFHNAITALVVDYDLWNSSFRILLRYDTHATSTKNDCERAVSVVRATWLEEPAKSRAPDKPKPNFTEPLAHQLHCLTYFTSLSPFFSLFFSFSLNVASPMIYHLKKFNWWSKHDFCKNGSWIYNEMHSKLFFHNF